MSMPGLAHEALLYRESTELVAGVRSFVQPANAIDAPVMMAVPGERIGLLRDGLGESGGRIRFEDMRELGRNPGRIIPALHEWLSGQRPGRAWFVGEPIWDGRRPAEIVEGTRHEALLNLAFADAPVSILCPYDARALPPAVLAGAERTHPLVRCDHQQIPSPAYADPETVYEAADQPLPAPPPDAYEQPITVDLGGLRPAVTGRAGRAGLGRSRISDLLLAVQEAATNALLHGRQPATLRMWEDDGALVVELRDGGRITDPLAGRRRPDGRQHDGRGLWLMHHLCDLVEVRPGPAGTTVRLHMLAR
jgi:anti-sigma regulatory factor (Ser/Thr protein kinase)